MQRSNQVSPSTMNKPTETSLRWKLSIKETIKLLIGTTLPIVIGIYTAVTNEQMQRSARLAEDKQQSIANERRVFDLERARELHQQKLYKNFLDVMYTLHKDGELNDSADPWAFANAHYRAVHREFDFIRKAQALLFLKEKELIGRQQCITGCEEKLVKDIIRLIALNFDNMYLSSETNDFNLLDFKCVRFHQSSMTNAVFSHVNLNGAVFDSSRLSGVKFTNSSLNCTIFNGTKLDGVDFGDSSLNGALFIDVDLSKAKLTANQQQEARFDNVILPNGTKISFLATTMTMPATYEDISSTTEIKLKATLSTITSKREVSTTVSTDTESTTTATSTSTTTTTSTSITTTTSTSTATTTKTSTTTTTSTSTTTTTSTSTVTTTSTSTTTTTSTSITTTTSTSTTTTTVTITRRNISGVVPNITENTRWTRNAATFAGSDRKGNETDSFDRPHGLYVDDESQNIYIADYNNNRILEWKVGATNGIVVAGGNGQGSGNHQLNRPTDVTVDKLTNSLIICDYLNNRVVRWNRGNTTSGVTIIYIDCQRLTVDNQGYIYVSTAVHGGVKRFRQGDTKGVQVVGGNGTAGSPSKLTGITYIFVDQDQSIYVSDSSNHRVMKWVKDATEGIIVAGNGTQGNSLTQLSMPRGLYVDAYDRMYVVDSGNHRIVRWSHGSSAATVIAGANGFGKNSSQLSNPESLSFDQYGNLYVVDQNNNRIQKFSAQ